LRHVSDTKDTLEEINADTGQDFFNRRPVSADGASRFKGTGHCKNRINPASLVHTRILLERQFEAAQQTLIAQQRQTFKLLQEFCIEVACNQASAKPAAGIAWSEQPVNSRTRPESPKPPLFPFIPQHHPPEMPEMITDEAAFAPLTNNSSKRKKMHGGTPMSKVPADIHKESLENSRMRASKTTALSDLEDTCQEMKSEGRRSLNYSEFSTLRNQVELVHDDIANERKGPKEDWSFDHKKSTPAKAIFADAAAMKAKVKENIMKPDYNVAQFYKTEGYPQEIARSAIFDNVTLAVIGLNALWIWIDTDYNDSATLLDAHPVFQVGENLFCAYFALELLIRFLAFNRKRDCMRDAWFGNGDMDPQFRVLDARCRHECRDG